MILLLRTLFVLRCRMASAQDMNGMEQGKNTKEKNTAGKNKLKTLDNQQIEMLYNLLTATNPPEALKFDILPYPLQPTTVSLLWPKFLNSQTWSPSETNYQVPHKLQSLMKPINASFVRVCIRSISLANTQPQMVIDDYEKMQLRNNKLGLTKGVL
jgi:hypothetical protein